MGFFHERRVLHVGCGSRNAAKLHRVFSAPGWIEIRLDIDAKVEPDIVSSMVDLRDAIEDRSCDAIWSSHNLEHLYPHEAPRALAEFHRVLRSDGFALITCPDVVAVARLIVNGTFDEPAYHVPAGPISPRDMLWGHARAIAGGNIFMAHHTGFTCASLGRSLMDAGFAEAWAFSGAAYDLWAVGLMDETDRGVLHHQLAVAGLSLPDEKDADR